MNHFSKKAARDRSSLTKHSIVETKWDSIYETCDHSEPIEVLITNSFLLPKTGCALDLACGLGENALLLAELGLQTQAWDVSSIALNRLKQRAKQQNLEISTKQLFVMANLLPKNTFDVIVVSRFLDRSLSDAIIAALKSGGLLYYQTFVREKLADSGPKNPDFLLQRNELLELFSELKVVAYRENSIIGDLECGERNEALFVGQKV